METKTFFRIKYEDVFSGEIICYMNIGFETELSAKIELNKILKEQQRLKSLGINYVVNGYRSAVFSGKNFIIEPIKIKKTIK
jgi:hypothetical protein